MGVTLALYVASVALAFYLYHGNVVWLIALAGAGQVIYQAGACFISYFQGLERLEYVGLGALARSVLYFVLGWVLVGFAKEWGLVLAMVLSNVLALAVYYYYFRSEVIFGRPFEVKFDYETGKQLVLESLPFTVNIVSGTLVVFADRFILSLARYEEVAYYALPAALVFRFNLVGADRLDLLQHILLASHADRHHQDQRSGPDDHAEGSQCETHLIAAESLVGKTEDLAVNHTRRTSFRCGRGGSCHASLVRC
jgi:Na+-driven multidrug efflux pump